MTTSKGWAIYSPVTKSIALSSFSTNPADCRRWAIRYGTVFGGGAPHERWAFVKAKGYRIVRVTVIIRERRK